MTRLADRRLGALAGVVATLAMTLAMALLRFATGWVSLPELIAEWFITVLPAPLFSALLDALQLAAKPLLLAGILLGQVAVGALLGSLYGAEPTLARAVRIVGVTWLVTVVVGLLLLGAGLFGAQAPAGPVATSGSVLVLYACFGLVLVGVYRLGAPATNAPAPAVAAALTRRELIRRLAVGGVVALGLGSFTWRWLSGQAGAGLARAPAEPEPAGAFASGDPFALRGLVAEVTPNREHYVVSKNFVDPAVDVRSWTLTVDGLVDRPFTLTYDEFTALPSKAGYYTLECISNEVGGDLISTARWTGVPLADLLGRAGLQPGAVDVVLYAADNYSDSIPVERALHPDTLLAHTMNGERLPNEHGFPARLLVPGIYGMKNVKWVKRIEVAARDHQGYWQERGWSDVAVYKTMSRIDVPRDRAFVSVGPAGIGGIAFAGDRGISKVEVSLDGGATWREALLKTPPLSPYTWVLWALPWEPIPGTYSVVVRATDGSGATQPRTEVPPLPDGASGWHRVTVRVG